MTAPTIRPLRPRPKLMTLTDAAAERVRALLAEKGEGAGSLKIGVKNGGCAGMEYTLSWSEKPEPLDEAVEDKGVKILIEPKAVLYLLGTEMDYKVDKLAAQFVFNNPNQKSACGCGESVNLVPVPKDRLEALKA